MVLRLSTVHHGNRAPTQPQWNIWTTQKLTFYPLKYLEHAFDTLRIRQSQDSSSSSCNGTSGGTIAGIVLGTFFGTILLLWLFNSLRTSNQSSNAHDYSSTTGRRKHSRNGSRRGSHSTYVSSSGKTHYVQRPERVYRSAVWSQLTADWAKIFKLRSGCRSGYSFVFYGP